MPLPRSRDMADAVREVDVMHRAGGGADVAQAWRMMAKEMRQVGHAPRLVDCGDGGHTAADFIGDRVNVIAKAQHGVTVHPAALVGKRGGEFPMVERLERF